jgi:hypothetical protein
MERSYDDEYGFSSRDIFAAAISAAELAELLRSPDGDEPAHWAGEEQGSFDFDADCELAD